MTDYACFHCGANTRWAPNPITNQKRGFCSATCLQAEVKRNGAVPQDNEADHAVLVNPVDLKPSAPEIIGGRKVRF